MTRLVALLVALAFAFGAGTTTAWAQPPKDPPKPQPKAPATKKEPLDINSASADELKALKGHRRGRRQEDRREPALQDQGRARREEGGAEGDLRQDQGPDRRQVEVATAMRTGRLIQVGRFTVAAMVHRSDVHP